jgi:hypothetical protein
MENPAALTPILHIYLALHDADMRGSILMVFPIKRSMDVQSKNDFIWSVFNRLVFEAPSKPGNLFYNLRWLYVEMFGFLIKEKKKAAHILKQIHYCNLVLELNNDYVVEATIRTTGCCPECSTHEGLKMTIAEAINKELLPFPECTRDKGCVCFYGFRLKRDQD